MGKKITETPLMKQYVEMKSKHPDAILLFRVGDFYETFSDDAIAASEILGITLTRRGNGASSFVELAGFPHHALDTYLPKLVRAGKRVAICEQLEDPKLTKKLVKRGITELVTPGVAMTDNVLRNRENNFLAAVHFGKKQLGLALLDISTGEFLAAEGAPEHIIKLLGNFQPKEVIVERGNKQRFQQLTPDHYIAFELDDWIFTSQSANERLNKQFETASLKGFGVENMADAIIAAGATLHYLDQTLHTRTAHIAALTRIDQDKYVRLDSFTVRNLELVQSMAHDGKSLLEIIDRTATPMGARMLRRWILFPLRDINAINKRLDVVEHFFRKPTQREEIKDLLSQIGDIERLTSKAVAARISPREMVQLRLALEAVAKIKEICQQSDNHALHEFGIRLDACTPLQKRIADELVDDAPASLNKGTVFKKGVSAELDQLTHIAHSGKSYLNEMQARESAATGIPSLKIGFNNVFGYYIEVTNTHRSKVPAEWTRKQTLTNAERYITQELKDYEEKIVGAQERIDILKTQLFEQLVQAVAQFIPALQTNASVLARLDCLQSLTRVAMENHYNRPVVDDSLTLRLVEARHPVIEHELPAGEPYISNTVELENNHTQVMMITGPNMSGKSALLRQTALNVILAQMGSFVAADSAHIGVVDKIFTRVGASDNISHGESTFMVEMNEAANILNNMSQRSLILFDELGRGTSTYDGISIAWAIVEHIHENSSCHPKTLFATHYHELNEMESLFERVVNFNVAVKEIDGKVVFMRKLQPGGSEHSFGIHVAKLAGMPSGIIKRARAMLKHLEDINRQGESSAPSPKIAQAAAQASSGVQMSFFQLDDPVLTQIRDEILNTDINSLTPLGALNKLNEIKKIITGR